MQARGGGDATLTPEPGVSAIIAGVWRKRSFIIVRTFFAFMSLHPTGSHQGGSPGGRGAATLEPSAAR
eukprot:15317414-Alexandrium_andersonii.AAC.1